MPRDLELFVVRKIQRIQIVVVRRRDGENLLPEFFQRKTGDLCHALRHRAIHSRAGRGLKHDGVGHDGRGEQTREFFAWHNAALEKHARNDGAGTADRLVAHVDGRVRLHLREAVVVDDFEYLRLLQTGDRLMQLVVIHQNHALSLGAQQVKARERADHAIVFIENGITAKAGFQRRFPHVVQIIRQMKRDEIFSATDA